MSDSIFHNSIIDNNFITNTETDLYEESTKNLSNILNSLKTNDSNFFWEIKNIQIDFTISVTDISDMFNCCSSLISLPDISRWDTSKVNDMSNIFDSCSSLISLPDISRWDTSKVNDMSNMFYSCSSLISLPDLSK